MAWLLSGGGAKNNVSFDSGNAYADPLREVTPLYTAPPAPVSVPDEVTTEDCPAFVKYDVTDVDEAWSRGFNACRTAMLQGAVGNSPVIPDGWVLVPIEPTYQMCEAMGLQWESPRFPDRYKAMLAAVKK
ncbi:TPA: hypothetical protein QH591_000836 [Enterobacter hormaechei subsp. steigerwaltii]|nr:hypothetical protein [Enterobacter hormaechei subsp. steigerwaltii]